MAPVTTPQDITAAVKASFAAVPDARLRYVMERLVEHLHAFTVEVRLSQQEWAAGIDFLTRTGHMCTPERQEFILLSDTMGVSMLVDLLENEGATEATESTVLGPFYVPGSPWRPMGSSIVEQAGSGEPARVSGTVREPGGTPIGDAVIDVWQNAANGKYAVQDSGQPPENLRGRFRTGPDGRFSFWSVRPTDYCIPGDGPVGRMLASTGRHPWRPAHLHLIVSAPAHVRVTTHLFDGESPYLDSDTVFAVKGSLVCHFDRHEASEPGAAATSTGPWYSLEHDLVLPPALP
jgi:catechol 1,2-dioxygenase